MVQSKLYLFGAPRLEHGGQPIVIPLRKALALFVYLAVTRQPHSRDALATLFWPERNQQGARTNLRRTLYDLGQLLGAPLGDQLLQIGSETVSLHPAAALWVDTAVFEQGLAQHLSATPAAQGLPHAELLALTPLADLYTDDFLAGFSLPDCPAFAEWQFFHRQLLRNAYTRLLQELVSAYAAAEKWDEAIHYARHWLLLEPLEETVHRQLMHLYAQAHQAPIALRQYEECVRILATELNVTPQAETTALYEAIRTKRFPLEKLTKGQDDKMTSAVRAPAVQPEPQVVRALSPFLPAQMTPFIGRVQELADILQRLHDPACRMLTLIGPGGIGKTRLAVAVAQSLADAGAHANREVADLFDVDPRPQFPDGVFFVGLQAVSRPEGLVPAIAEVTGLHFYGDAAPQQQLLTFLQTKRLLLILDNFEHLLSGVEVLAAILKLTPDVKLLVTSREALNLQEEWFHPLTGLSLPAVPGIAATWADKSHPSDAVQLFVQNARRASVTFSPATDAAHIARICRLVDGIPLALELAATWLKVLSCAQIADEIEHSLDILTTRQQNIPARHRSMRAVLEQSWQLLDAREQYVLKQLALFRGGFSQAAAGSVAGAALLVLAALVEKAFIYQSAGRYQLHELLRQFAAQQLAHSPDQSLETEARHSRYYLNFLQTCTDVKQIDPELENMRAGWRFAVAQAHFGWIQAAADALYRYYARRTLYQAGRTDFALIVERLEQLADPTWQALLGTTQRCLGAFCYYLGDYAAAQVYLDRALACAQAVNAQREIALVLAFLGLVTGWQGREAESDQRFEQSLALNRTLGDEQLKVELFIKIAQLRGQQGRYAEAQRFGEASLVASRQLGQAYWIIRALDALGFTMYRLGQHQQAKQYYGEGLQLAEQTSDQEGFILTSGGLGLAASTAEPEEIMAVLPALERGLQLGRQMGHPFYITSRLVILGALYNRLGQSEQVLNSCQEGVAVARKIGNPYFIVVNLHHMGIAARRLKQFKRSRACLSESILVALRSNMGSAICDGLYELALLLIESVNLDEMSEDAAQQQKAEALIWLCFALQHPACAASTAAHAQIQIAQLEAELPANQVAAAHAQSQKPLAQVAAELLVETIAAP